MYRKHIITGIITALILALIAAQADVKNVFSLSGSNGVFSDPNQTIPTRTPTPGPATNTPTPKPTKSSNGGGDEPATAVPTPTSQPLPTDTPTPIVTIAYTPVGGFVPTAEPCSSQPTIQVQNPTNVRQGPGVDYPVVTRLVYLEVRFITGRAADAPWWMIQLEDGANGWVADDVVTVQGYTGNVPIIAAPDINGQSPTPGTPWNPTPQPECTPPPTATATAVPPTATPNPTVVEAAADDPAATANTADTQPLPEATESPTETPQPQPTQTAVSPPTLMPTTAPNQPAPISSTAIPAAPVDTTATGSAADWLLPAAGLLLVAGVTASFIARRKK